MNPPLDSRPLAAIRKRLLSWYDESRRSLPWRADRDPYRIWVSEVMLQQTTVAAVVPYFERFIAAFPTVEALAAADEQHVLKLWEGLGYYRRARHLLAAARQLVDQYGGSLPDDPETWESLPGVGRYILGAVLSQAFDRKLPIVEANSLRVLARLFGYRGDPRTGEGKVWVWSAAERLLPARRAGDFNQALMELGALLCSPAAPQCRHCPIAGHCKANRDGLQSLIPPAKQQKQKVVVEEVAVILRRRGRVLICRRPPEATRWQNMWELPHAEVKAGESPSEAAVRAARELTGFHADPGDEVTTIRHTVTRFDIRMACIEADVRGGAFASSFYTAARWATAAQLATFPTSSAQRRLMAHLVNESVARNAGS